MKLQINAVNKRKLTGNQLKSVENNRLTGSQPKMSILSSFNHTHVFLNLYGFFSSVVRLKNLHVFSKQTVYSDKCC